MRWYDLEIVLDDTLAVKFLLYCPVVYVCLAMLIDAAGFIAKLNNLRRGFRPQAEGQLWDEASAIPNNSSTRAWVRAGSVLLLLALYSAS